MPVKMLLYPGGLGPKCSACDQLSLPLTGNLLVLVDALVSVIQLVSSLFLPRWPLGRALTRKNTRHSSVSQVRHREDASAKHRK
jgi:hypothetical protein